ncbi:cation diffusion facilitator family transporter [Desulfurococcus mucosus DSM 2162]|uniref:Cation diffusion facilitator family transporter n=1 Tax=Desulfurococcus mucosus (strain ATCC 35584 / DSM 2162 / JCM 9187 / O7/1) TaxID=765177 RepID=E8R9L2_DESM0|nr:cation diffusion facilitator family transporter [Desulfurococcus mucosus]ADV65188.1 cation diffusion facilitator family transporter [Desulfurococcus mucosus DSM 2162]
MGFTPVSSIEARLRSARSGFIASALLSFTGLVLELAVALIAPSIILITDLLHWTVDTVLEAVFLLVVYLASRFSKRFPWSIVMIEGVTVTTAILVILGLYGYIFLDYISSTAEGVSTRSLIPLVATLAGGVITVAMYIIQRRNYLRYRIELLRVDAAHALIDFIASILASIGIALTYWSGSHSVELLFTFMSMMFVVHSLFEVFKDIVRTLTGSNIDYELRARIKDSLIEDFSNVEVGDVDARKIGSFYVVSAKILVDPDMTMREIHRLRKRIVRSITSCSELIYHVDVKFYPNHRVKTRRRQHTR